MRTAKVEPGTGTFVTMSDILRNVGLDVPQIDEYFRLRKSGASRDRVDAAAMDALAALVNILIDGTENGRTIPNGEHWEVTKRLKWALEERDAARAMCEETGS